MDHVWYEIYVNGQLLKWLHAPFKLTDMLWHGMAVRIPENPEVFLVEEYGSGWRTPDPNFAQWACPNLAGGFGLSCRYMAHFDIFIALWRGHKARALEQCRKALELAPGDAFFLELTLAFAVAQETGTRQNRPVSSVNAAVERIALLSDAETNAADREKRD